MNDQIIQAVFTADPAAGPAARLVHLTLATMADEFGHVETTVHSLEHMTGLLPVVIEAVLGFNDLDRILVPGTVTLADGVIVADLPGAGPVALRAGA
jgi:hypothetical protein